MSLNTRDNETLEEDTEEQNETEELTQEQKNKNIEQAQPAKDQSIMDALFPEIESLPEVDDIIEGSVISIDKSAAYIDLGTIGTGIIYGKEFINARDIINRLHIGDVISGKVIEQENDLGYVEVSLKEARQALLWTEAEEAIKEKTVYELQVQDANKGGLILNWQGLQGFLPASQLKTENYPRVQDGDKDRILEELKKMIGERITVSIIGAIPEEGKLIFSEKSPEMKTKEKMVDRYEVGNELEGEITGIVDFGIFVKIEDGLEGLVHISEIDWGLVEDPRELYKVGDKVPVKIIEVKEDKISLSIKALKENPWVEASKKYKKGDTVDAVVIKYNKHGALASIEEGVAGLVHVSEFESEEELRQKLGLGKNYKFTITLFDPQEQKMALAYAEENPSTQLGASNKEE